MKQWFSVVTVLMGVMLSQSASAAVLAECGAFKGYGYFYPNDFTKGQTTGFLEDGISKGSFSIITVDDKFDVIYTDASGKTQSSRAQGATVIHIGTNSADGRFVILVTYPEATVEVYSYYGRDKTLTLLQHKYRGIVTSATGKP
ncbi:hypothetical protein N9748_00840 [bacterium]|nr:hypothetical protein [bacterium]